jgi:site-specific recombinase XerD
MKGCRVLKDSEIKKILNSLKIREQALFLTSLTFGTRISESLSLNFGDVCGDYLYIKSSKGSENQSFPIPHSYRSTINRLKVYYKSKGISVKDKTPLFMSQKHKTSKPMSRQLAHNLIRKVVRNCKLEGKINTHSFRKSFVTKIYEMTGYDIAQVRQYSRHRSLNNLQYYIGTTEVPTLVNNLNWV